MRAGPKGNSRGTQSLLINRVQAGLSICVLRGSRNNLVKFLGLRTHVDTTLGDPYRTEMPITSETTATFETSLKELEKIVSELEKGDLPLETQLKSFEKGVSLSRECMKRLEEVERRVETLMGSPEGKLTTAAFETGELA